MNRRRALVRVAAITVTAIAAAILIKGAITTAAQIHWSQLEPSMIGFALLAAILQECAGTAIAQAALLAFSQRTPFLRLLVITTVATTANSMVPMPAGIPARLWMQKQWLGVPLAASTAGMTLELVIGYGLLALLAIAGAGLFGANVIALGTHYAPIVVVAITIGVTAVWVLRKWLRVQLQRLKGLRPTPAPVFFTLVLSAAVIALATLRLWLILRALDTSAASILEITAAMCIARVAGVASMIPMGLGSRDVTLTGLLVLAGVPMSVAVIAAGVDRVLSTIPYMAIALAGWPLLRRAQTPEPADRH